MQKTNYRRAAWINNTNIYEVNLRQYTAEGTINAFKKELPRLKEMGVHCLWFMPLTPISVKNRKGSMGSYYACSDYTSIGEEFGNENDFREFVKEAHAMGFKVIIDWVANHTGWDHVWTTNHPEFYLTDEASGDFKTASGMDDIIELDYKNHEMRRAMIDAMEYWITVYDIDGFRADLASWVELGFWLEARTRLEKIKTLFWLAEADPVESPGYLDAFDAAYTWKWMHKTKDFYERKIEFPELRNILNHYNEVCGNHGIPLWFTSNHDENSWNGTEFEKYGSMMELLSVFNFTWNGMPMLYSGQELPNLKRLAFFDKDMIEWNGECRLHDFYKILLHLHTNNPALRAADANVVTHIHTTSNDRNIFAFLRKNGNNEVLVLLNFGDEKVSFGWVAEGLFGEFVNIFTREITNFSMNREIELRPWGYLVFKKNEQ